MAKISDKIRNQEKSIYYDQLMKYPLIFLRITGLYHERTDRFLFKVYCSFIILILCFNTIWNLLNFINNTYPILSDTTVCIIVFSVWQLKIFIENLIFFIIMEKQNYMQKLISDIESLIKKSGIDFKINKMKIILNLGLILTVALNLSLTLFLLIGIFPNTGKIKEIGSYFIKPVSSIVPNEILINFWYKLFITIFVCISLLAWTVTVFYYISFCILISYMYSIYNRKFKLFINNSILIDDRSVFKVNDLTSLRIDDEQFSSIYKEHDFEAYRLWYKKLSKLTDQFNKCFGLYLTIHFLVSIFLILFSLLLYSSWKVISCDILQILVLLLISSWAIFLLLILYSSAYINKKVIFSYSNYNFSEFYLM